MPKIYLLLLSLILVVPGSVLIAAELDRPAKIETLIQSMEKFARIDLSCSSSTDCETVTLGTAKCDSPYNLAVSKKSKHYANIKRIAQEIRQAQERENERCIAILYHHPAAQCIGEKCFQKCPKGNDCPN